MLGRNQAKVMPAGPLLPTGPLLIVAGERSGDLYGAQLAACLRRKSHELELFGCGGQEMRRAGVDTVVDAHDVTVVGITEVVSRLPRILRAFRRLLQQVDARKPRAAILIDFPDFNLRLAKRLKRRGIPVIYFVSPQIWAWRKSRLRVMRRTVRKMICIFPFEEDFYRQAGIEVEYVGHPLVGSVGPSSSREEFFARNRLDPACPTVALLPGSREGEVRHNLPAMLEAAECLEDKRKVQFVLPSAPTLPHGWMERAMGGGEGSGAPLRVLPLRVIKDGAYDALTYSTAAVVASGTATLEAGLLGCPMVVVYRVSALTWLVGKLLVDVPFYSMVNLIARRRVVRELFQLDFTGPKVAREVEALLDKQPMREKMIAELGEVKSALGRPGAVERAAESIFGILTL